MSANSSAEEIGRVALVGQRGLRVRPLVWFTLGWLASCAYTFWPLLYGPSTTVRVPTLPLPLFPSQAVILAALLLTPRRQWWLYLTIYFVLQLVQGAVTGLPGWFAVLSNVANVIEPLLGALLLTHFRGVVSAPFGLRTLG